MHGLFDLLEQRRQWFGWLVVDGLDDLLYLYTKFNCSIWLVAEEEEECTVLVSILF